MLKSEGEGGVRPIYRYLREESDRAAHDAFDAVPAQYDTFPQGRQLADAGAITPDELQLPVPQLQSPPPEQFVQEGCHQQHKPEIHPLRLLHKPCPLPAFR